MNIDKTKEYYSTLKRDNICSCVYCQNLVDEIKQSYPDVAEYLLTLGINIECPFEVLLPIETDDGYMDYYGVQYLIPGDSSGFEETKIGCISIFITDCHPDANYDGTYFVIEAGTFHIKCRYDKYSFE